MMKVEGSANRAEGLQNGEKEHSKDQTGHSLQSGREEKSSRRREKKLKNIVPSEEWETLGEGTTQSRRREGNHTILIRGGKEGEHLFAPYESGERGVSHSGRLVLFGLRGKGGRGGSKTTQKKGERSTSSPLHRFVKKKRSNVMEVPKSRKRRGGIRVLKVLADARRKKTEYQLPGEKGSGGEKVLGGHKKERRKKGTKTKRRSLRRKRR